MMNDQAERLRRLVNSSKVQDKKGVVVGILSGKGGVGKSVFSINFSISLSQMGKKVLIIDLDVGMGNIDHLLGKPAKYNIADSIHDKLRLDDVIFTGPGNISCISGGNGMDNLFRLEEQNLSVFLEQIERIRKKYDYVLFDFGAGVSEDMIHFLLAAHQIILVTTPEPPAMADAYSALKLLLPNNQNLQVSCVVNMVENLQEGRETWERLSGASARFMGKGIKWLTALHRDRAVLRSVKEQVPCVLQYPRSKYSVEMKLLASSFIIGEQTGEAAFSGKTYSFSTRVKSYFRMFGGKKL
ncbi:MinD/ParA family protein [Sporolactobacillus shoreae]|uniref:MinD/ParA family protein n=2 Tax=Sporolactobacillus shoreae TaxID=1465501 RepID=A0A4Z0GSS7_9BACL|nr:MinD/ParA family protein [Sporolactobacillus shoreae]